MPTPPISQDIEFADMSGYRIPARAIKRPAPSAVQKRGSPLSSEQTVASIDERLAPPLARSPRNETTVAASEPPRRLSFRSLPTTSPATLRPPMPHFTSSPSIQLDPVRTDYFQSATREQQSWRALMHLAAVVGGRVLITFGAGGLNDGFAPIRDIGPGVLPPNQNVTMGPPPNLPVVDHAVALGISGIVVGTIVALSGVVMFARDTHKLGPRRAFLIGGMSAMGIICIVTASIVYIYGQAQRNIESRYTSLIPRFLGNFLLFYAITNSFPASEIVHGNVPLPNREQCRLVSFAAGGASMIIYAIVSSGSQNAPIWARELCKAVGISGLHIGASLGRTDSLRWQSENRFLQQLRIPSMPAIRRGSLPGNQV